MQNDEIDLHTLYTFRFTNFYKSTCDKHKMQVRVIINNNVIRMKEPAVITWLFLTIEIQNMIGSIF